jgi:multiple sugar transport system substrate-binding protein
MKLTGSSHFQKRKPALLKMASFGLSMLMLLVVLTSCTGQPSFSLPFLDLVITPTKVVKPISTLTPAPTQGIAASPTPAGPQQLTIWLPPEFNPQSDTRAGRILKSRLDEFSRVNNVKIEVRIKALSGPSSLLDSLTAANAVAPAAVPSLIALPRSDMENAALKGLLYPLDGVSTLIDESDWYDYARELAMVQGVTFGLPFAGDGLVIVYRSARVIAPPTTWDAVQRLSQPVAIPFGSQQSLTTIALYHSVGGEVEDAQRRPILQADKLVKVLDLYKQGSVHGIYPNWLTQMETDDQVWQAYQEQRVNVAVTWSSFYLANLPPDSAALPLPALGDQPSGMATAWAWAVSDPDPDRRLLSTHLAEWLVETNFLASWSEAAGFLPTRPSSIATWQDQTLKATFSQVALSAHARPSNDLITSLGPVLKEAALKVIRQESDPTQAAAAAAERLMSPQTR